MFIWKLSRCILSFHKSLQVHTHTNTVVVHTETNEANKYANLKLFMYQPELVYNSVKVAF